MKNIIILALVTSMLIGLALYATVFRHAGDDLLKNKALVTEFFEQFSAGDVDNAFAMVSDDVRWWVPEHLPFSGTKNKAEYLQIAGSIKQGFPDGLQLTVMSMIGEGDKIAAEVQSYGQHLNGKTYTNKYHFLITIEAGKMVEIKEYMNTLHLYQLIQP